MVSLAVGEVDVQCIPRFRVRAMMIGQAPDQRRGRGGGGEDADAVVGVRDMMRMKSSWAIMESKC